MSSGKREALVDLHAVSERASQLITYSLFIQDVQKVSCSSGVVHEVMSLVG